MRSEVVISCQTLAKREARRTTKHNRSCAWLYVLNTAFLLAKRCLAKEQTAKAEKDEDEARSVQKGT